MVSVIRCHRDEPEKNFFYDRNLIISC